MTTFFLINHLVDGIESLEYRLGPVEEGLNNVRRVAKSISAPILLNHEEESSYSKGRKILPSLYQEHPSVSLNGKMTLAQDHPEQFQPGNTIILAGFNRISCILDLIARLSREGVRVVTSPELLFDKKWCINPYLESSGNDMYSPAKVYKTVQDIIQNEL